jgi:hypothetical protein
VRGSTEGGRLLAQARFIEIVKLIVGDPDRPLASLLPENVLQEL